MTLRSVVTRSAAPARALAGPSVVRPRLTPTLITRAASSGPRRPARPLTPRAPEKPSIPFEHVHVVDATTNTLGPLVSLASVVSALDPATHAVWLVSSSPPVVRVLDLKDESAKSRAHETKLKLSRRLAPEDKEVQVSWGAAGGDLAHKAAAARDALARGDRVTLIFAPRAGQPEPAPRRRAEIVKMFEDALEHVGQRWRDDEAKGAMLVGKWKSKDEGSVDRKKKVVDGQAEKKKAKQEEKEARRKKEEERARKAEEARRAAAERA
ncbi:hypothetical protein Q5752_003978 [Cryptotrichosporon argae]